MADATYMPDYIKTQSELAHTYAEDGAYMSAARVLETLAVMVRGHADSIYSRETSEQMRQENERLRGDRETFHHPV